MSKNKTVVKTEDFYCYSISRKDSGYFITKYLIQDNQIVSEEKVSEPDVLVITMSKLEKFVRKDHGI